jgi:hypothetical protein
MKLILKLSGFLGSAIPRNTNIGFWAAKIALRVVMNVPVVSSAALNAKVALKE